MMMRPAAVSLPHFCPGEANEAFRYRLMCTIYEVFASLHFIWCCALSLMLFAAAAASRSGQKSTRNGCAGARRVRWKSAWCGRFLFFSGTRADGNHAARVLCIRVFLRMQCRRCTRTTPTPGRTCQIFIFSYISGEAHMPNGGGVRLA